jgi:hypothetical protein
LDPPRRALKSANFGFVSPPEIPLTFNRRK